MHDTEPLLYPLGKFQFLVTLNVCPRYVYSLDFFPVFLPSAFCLLLTLQLHLLAFCMFLSGFLCDHILKLCIRCTFEDVGRKKIFQFLQSSKTQRLSSFRHFRVGCCKNDINIDNHLMLQKHIFLYPILSLVLHSKQNKGEMNSKHCILKCFYNYNLFSIFSSDYFSEKISRNFQSLIKQISIDCRSFSCVCKKFKQTML